MKVKIARCINERMQSWSPQISDGVHSRGLKADAYKSRTFIGTMEALLLGTMEALLLGTMEALFLSSVRIQLIPTGALNVPLGTRICQI